MRLLSSLKQVLVPGGKKPRVIPLGPCRGVKMMIDYRHRSLFYLGLYETELYSWLRKLSSGIRTAVDIGTADGLYVLYFLAKTGAERVYSFDPLEEANRELEENLRLNDFEHSKRLIHQVKFVGNMNDSKTCTLDSFASRVTFPCLILMDAEGAEGLILEGAKELLGASRVRWIVETHSLDLEKKCLRVFENAGYRVRIISHAWWRVIFPEKRFGHNRWFVAVKDMKI